MREKGEAEALDLDAERSGGTSGGEAAEQDEEEVGQLEAEVKEMAVRIRHLRSTVPGRLVETLSAQLASQRPRLSLPSEGLRDEDSQAGSSGPSREGTSAKPQSSISEADKQVCERLHIFRAKIASNVDAMPNILKRINGCIARMKKTDQNNITIHPVFKRRRKF